MDMLDEYLYLIEDNEDKYNFLFNAAMLGKILEQEKKEPVKLDYSYLI